MYQLEIMLLMKSLVWVNVINIEGNGNDTKATVKFKKFGEKNLLLRFAKLNKV